MKWGRFIITQEDSQLLQSSLAHKSRFPVSKLFKIYASDAPFKMSRVRQGSVSETLLIACCLLKKISLIFRYRLSVEQGALTIPLQFFLLQHPLSFFYNTLSFIYTGRTKVELKKKIKKIPRWLQVIIPPNADPFCEGKDIKWITTALCCAKGDFSFWSHLFIVE